VQLGRSRKKGNDAEKNWLKFSFLIGQLFSSLEQQASRFTMPQRKRENIKG